MHSAFVVFQKHSRAEAITQQLLSAVLPEIKRNATLKSLGEVWNPLQTLHCGPVSAYSTKIYHLNCKIWQLNLYLLLPPRSPISKIY